MLTIIIWTGHTQNFVGQMILNSEFSSSSRYLNFSRVVLSFLISKCKIENDSSLEGFNYKIEFFNQDIF